MWEACPYLLFRSNPEIKVALNLICACPLRQPSNNELQLPACIAFLPSLSFDLVLLPEDGGVKLVI